jgi:hypothetical protein
LKVGAENRKKLGIMVALALVAVFMLLRTLNTPGSQAATANVTVPTTTRQSPEQRRTQRARGAQLTSNLDPTLRLDLLAASEQTSYKGTGRNIFKPQPEPVIAKIPQEEKKILDYTVPKPPPPPPINMKFFGFANKPGEPKRVFLAQGDDVFIAGEGEIVNRRYRVVRISPASVEVEDVLTNHSENLPLTQG